MSSLLQALDAATETLAVSACFRNRVGASHSWQARKHIGYDTLVDNDGLHVRRPCAILKVTSRGSNEVAEGIAIDLVAGGGVILYLCDNAREQRDHSQSYRDFLRFAGGVIDDMELRSGFDEYLPFHDAEMVMPPQRTHRSVRSQDQSNDYWECAYLLQYGDRP